MSKLYIGVILSCCLWFVWAVDQQKLFTGYQVIEVGGVGEFDDDELLLRLNIPEEDELEILHRNKIEGTAQVLVKPEVLPKFVEEVIRNHFTHEVVVQDIEVLLRAQELLRANSEPLKGESTFDRYMELSEIEEYLLNMQMKYPNKVELSIAGSSLNEETIILATITDDIAGSKGKEKPVVFIEAGVHAREWISVASALYLIDQLANSTDLTRDVEWRIIPVSNPDGYRYSWTKNRLWRKNLRTFTEEKHCQGVDLNRNFGSFWGGPGTSKRRCSQIYAGSAAFSEPETQAIKKAFMDVKPRIKAYISIHSYGQMILIPPSHSNMVMTQRCSDLMDSVAEKMSKIIANTTNAKYIFGSPFKLLYPATGTSMDWAFVTGDAPITFTFELRDQGKAGFLLPEHEILNGVREFYSAMTLLHGVVNITNAKDITQRQKGSCYEKSEASEHLSLDISDIIKNLKLNSYASPGPQKTAEAIDSPAQGVGGKAT